MTRDDIIRMAREADPGFEGGEESDGTMTDSIVGIDQVFKFASLAASAEREACAKVCDTMSNSDFLPHQCAAAIRARGNQ